MIRSVRTSASRKPSTVCCKTGLPRTSIIGFGSSAVSSRMRVPRPAARMTALSIFIVLCSMVDFSSSSPLSGIALRGRAPASGFPFRHDQRRQIGLLDQLVHFSDILALELRPFLQLLVELIAQQMKGIELRLGRLVVAGFNGVAKCVELLVQHVGKSEVPFRTFHVYLNQFLFDVRHFLIEIVG